MVNPSSRTREDQPSGQEVRQKETILPFSDVLFYIGRLSALLSQLIQMPMSSGNTLIAIPRK
jgi:hypothetical protein